MELKEQLQMATKTNKSSETVKVKEVKPKRASKSARLHVRRLKQEARKTPGSTHA
jgi:hypothetical protein